MYTGLRSLICILIQHVDAHPVPNSSVYWSIRCILILQSLRIHYPDSPCKLPPPFATIPKLVPILPPSPHPFSSPNQHHSPPPHPPLFLALPTHSLDYQSFSLKLSRIPHYPSFQSPVPLPLRLFEIVIFIAASQDSLATSFYYSSPCITFHLFISLLLVIPLNI